MKPRKRTEITIETREVMVIRQGGLDVAWCASCGQQVSMVRLREADLMSLPSEANSQGADAGQLHIIETADGSPGLCLASLLRSLFRHDLPLCYRKEQP